MDAKAEAKAAADAVRHAEQFRKAHGISREEWDLAESMAEDIGDESFRHFWEIYDRES